MSVASPLGTVGILVRYWVKGRFTKATILGLIIGEGFSVVFILFGSSTYLSFSNRVGLTTGLSEVAGSLVLALYLVGLIQSGFNGGGLPVSSSDVDYVFTSPVPPREVFAAKVLLIVLVLVLSLLPITLLIPGIPVEIADVTRVLPNGLAAIVSVGLVSGTPGGLDYLVDLLLLFAWLGGFLVLGVRMARGHFYELLEVSTPGGEKFDHPNQTSRLDPRGKSIWSIVRLKEKILISRTREARALFINAMFLSGFLVIYALSGSFQSSPTSFLFILFIIGSFGSGTASRWIEKERLWILKSSPVSMRRYVKEVYRARVAPLLIYLIPVTIAVGVPLVLSQLSTPSLLLGVILALPGALEIAGITMAGGMYFASRYGQSSADDILSSQAQELADIRRFLFQTIINLIMVSPIILLVLVSEALETMLGPRALPVLAVGLVSVSIAFTGLSINLLLNRAGDAITRREDL